MNKICGILHDFRCDYVFPAANYIDQLKPEDFPKTLPIHKFLGKLEAIFSSRIIDRLNLNFLLIIGMLFCPLKFWIICFNMVYRFEYYMSAYEQFYSYELHPWVSLALFSFVFCMILWIPIAVLLRISGLKTYLLYSGAISIIALLYPPIYRAYHVSLYTQLLILELALSYYDTIQGNSRTSNIASVNQKLMPSFKLLLFCKAVLLATVLTRVHPDYDVFFFVLCVPPVIAIFVGYKTDFFCILLGLALAGLELPKYNFWAEEEIWRLEIDQLRFFDILFNIGVCLIIISTGRQHFNKLRDMGNIWNLELMNWGFVFWEHVDYSANSRRLASGFNTEN